MFDEKTAANIKYYVYALIDPRDNEIFYVGKGTNNRVFDHLKCALEVDIHNNKYDRIRNIVESDNSVGHIIIRHDLKENEAYIVESTVIDLLGYINKDIKNEISGHHAFDRGIMTSDEVKRLYGASPLYSMGEECMMININKTYKRGSGHEGIYNATKGSWVINKNRTDSIKYVLSEYRGLIVEVFEVKKWSAVERVGKNGKPKTRWEFKGEIAPEGIRENYINKSVSHVKKQGSANPIRYKI
jgi:hypothetical protein